MRRGLLLSIALCACGSDSTESDCPEGETRIDGRCVPAEASCDGVSLSTLDGRCVPVGLPADGCAEGFAWSDGACSPILPDEPCPSGTMALPGETACRPVMECPGEPWGGIDGGPAPQWVDDSYTGNDSDGSQARPWSTLTQAIANASSGATIGIAAGTYVGNLAVNGKLLHLRGTCPAEVSLEGVASGNGAPTVVITGAGASGTTLTGLSVTGPSVAVAMSGVESVLLDRVWLHDTGDVSLDVEDPLGPASVTLTDSLVEAGTGQGALALGATLHVVRSVIRATRDDGIAPSGLFATGSEYSGQPATLTIDHAVVVDNAGGGVFAIGSAVGVDVSVVADNRAVEEGRGYGIGLQDDLATGLPSEGVVARSVVSRNALAGISVLASTLRVEGTTIADTHAWNDPTHGTSEDGRGLNIQDGEMGGPSTVEVFASSVSGSRGLGLFVAGSSLVLEDSWIHDCVPAELDGGRGVNIQPSVHGAGGSSAIIRQCLISNNQQFGLFVGDSEAHVERSEIRGVTPAAELGFGDAATAIAPLTFLTLLDSRLADSARAGLSLFSASATVSGSVLSCHPIDIATQDFGAGPANLTDGGGNTCGCGDESHECRASSTQLEPPSPL